MLIFSKYFIINLLKEKGKRRMKEKLGGLFKQIFDEASEGIYFSPGRINLIGEHTDYNGGHVFPAAITIGTYGLLGRDKIINYVFIRKNFHN